MLGRINGWTRLAIVSAATWILAVSLYAGYVWINPHEFYSSLIYWVIVTPESTIRISSPTDGWTRIPMTLWQSSYVEQRFYWDRFAGFCGSGVAVIALVCLGIPWVIRGFRGANTQRGSAETMALRSELTLPPVPEARASVLLQDGSLSKS